MKRFIKSLDLFSTTCIALCLMGCQHEAYYEDDIMNSVVFENKTEHSLHLDMWINEEKTEELFCSFDIPSGANSAKDFIYYKFFSPLLFSSCSIVFDDGRSLRYPREIKGSRQRIPAYSKNYIDGICVWTFTITDEHYQLAE